MLNFLSGLTTGSCLFLIWHLLNRPLKFVHFKLVDNYAYGEMRWDGLTSEERAAIKASQARRGK